MPEFYLHGLAEGDFDLALRGLLGDSALLAARSVARLKDVWHAEYEAWARLSCGTLRGNDTSLLLLALDKDIGRLPSGGIRTMLRRALGEIRAVLGPNGVDGERGDRS